MKQRTLGKSGLLVSVVGLGAGSFGSRTELEVARRIVHRALDLGITLIDTAEAYGNGKSEETLGAILGDRRKDVLIASKWTAMGPGSTELRCGSRDYIMKAVERSLARLKTDYIDLYQIHKPDPLTPIEETLRTLDDLVRQGKIRYIGVSNMPAWRIVEAQLVARQLGLNAFISNQDQYSVLVRDAERDVLPATTAYGLGLIPYSPLAQGMLTGKYQRNAPMLENTLLAKMPADRTARILNDTNFGIVEKLTDFAETRGHTLLELAMSWLVAKPYVSSIIAGATRPEHVESNTAAASWELSADEIAEIDRLSHKE